MRLKPPKMPIQLWDDAEQALEDLCDEYPPICRDDWIEESGNPGSRVTTKDLFLNDVWADQVWLDYENGDISAQEASDRWSQDPPADFARDELRKLEEARPLKPVREKAIKDAKAKAEKARADAETAKKKADSECAKAEAAKKALDACLAGELESQEGGELRRACSTQACSPLGIVASLLLGSSVLP